MPAILVHEYVTGGGWPDATPPALGAEAHAMLRAVLRDFRAWGQFPVVTTHDRRLTAADLPADEVVSLDGEAYPGALLELAGRCAATLLIAPESGGVHERLAALLHEAGATLLGSLPHGVAVAADKWTCGRRLAEAGLPVPESRQVEPAAAVDAARDLGFPLVVKPVRGAGCQGVVFVPDMASLAAALAQDGLCDAEAVLLQRYVPGSPVSVSLLVAGGRSLPLGLNRQDVRRGTPFVYGGGVAGIGHERRDEAFALAARAVAAISGLRGYVGVDMVLGDSGCTLIEVNPRLTTSYVGLRRVVDLNIARAVWGACVHGNLPVAVTAGAAAAFTTEGCGER